MCNCIDINLDPGFPAGNLHAIQTLNGHDTVSQRGLAWAKIPARYVYIDWNVTIQ